MARISFPVLILVALAAAAIGFGGSRFLDNGTMQKLAADRDQARDCRHSGSTLPPCPVEYKNTQTVWREKVETKEVPDPKQAERIAVLSADLADSQRTVREMERRLAARWAPRPALYHYLQNGSMAHPYDATNQCPAETPVVYVAAPFARSQLRGRAGDPNVCYVRIASRR